METRNKGWASILVGTILAIGAGVVSLTNLSFPYIAISPILAVVSGILISNGWRLLKIAEEKPYKSKEALHRFKRHHQIGKQKDILRDVNLWEAHLIGAADDKDYERVSELIVELLLAGGVVTDGNVYGLISNRVESFITRFSDDTYIVERVLPAIIGVVEHFHEQQFPQGVARALVTFVRVCEQTAALSGDKLKQVAQCLASISKMDLKFREVEEWDVQYLSVFYKLLPELKRLENNAVVNELSDILRTLPKERALAASELARKDQTFTVTSLA